MSITYKDSGVDIEKGDALVERIKTKVKKTYGDRVKSGVGGFACLYETGDRLLAAGTDGVGTKLKLAFECNKHDTVGIDLVAMCVNDIICTGATPLFFMDYLATGKLDLEVSEAIVDGVVEGCLQSSSALIGGETAEMPGMYGAGEYDLAGFAVGEVFPDDILGGDKVKAGQALIGLRSSGFHSNGYSLLRKVIESESLEVKKKFLTPTRIYCKQVVPLLKEKMVSAMAHITGGGLYNIPRMNGKCDYHLNFDLESWRTEIFTDDFRFIQEKANIDMAEMLKTFNGGIGLVIATDNADGVKSLLSEMGEDFIELGHITEGTGEVYLKDQIFNP